MGTDDSDCDSDYDDDACRAGPPLQTGAPFGMP